MLHSESSQPTHTADDHGSGMYINTHIANTILFKSWETTSWQELLLACLFTATIGFLHQKIVDLRDGGVTAFDKSCSTAKASVDDKSKQDQPSEETKLTEKKGTVSSRFIFPSRHNLGQTVLFFFQVWLALISMLLVMTFNIYICLALTLGKTLGFFFFSWMNEISSKRDTKTS